jgi:hypothetical protein
MHDDSGNVPLQTTVDCRSRGMMVARLLHCHLMPWERGIAREDSADAWSDCRGVRENRLLYSNVWQCSGKGEVKLKAARASGRSSVRWKRQRQKVQQPLK